MAFIKLCVVYWISVFLCLNILHVGGNVLIHIAFVNCKLNAFYFEIYLFRMSTKLKLNSVALVRERTIPTERPPPVGEVSANFCG